MTNYFMGLRTGGAVAETQGAGPCFELQCLKYFERQVDIVNPRMLVVMGKHACGNLSWFEPKVYVPHPSTCRDRSKRALQVPRKVAALVAAIANLGKPL